jgi:hypothetical protein
MATAGAKPSEIAVSFKNAITIKRGSGSFEGLTAKDKVSVSGRQIEVSLSTALTENDNQIKFAENAIRDLLGNKSLEISSPEIEDLSGPILNKVTLGSDNKTVTVAFDEEAFNAGAGTKAEKLTALRNAITFASDGSGFNAIGATDTVELSGGVVKLKFETALSGSANRIRIAADSIQDLFKNKNGILTTSPIVADAVGPVCKTPDEDNANLCADVILPSKMLNRTINVMFNERLSLVNKNTIKSAVTLSTNGTYGALGSSDKVSVSKNRLVVTFSKPLEAGKEYQVKIATGAVKDFFGNQNLEVETITFEVDTSGPKLR